MEKFNKNDYSVDQATHNLRCRQGLGYGDGIDYTMPCVLIKPMGDNSKIVAFGERNQQGREHVKHVRYVSNDKLSLIQ